LGGPVEIAAELAPDLWPALVDPTQIELVILNLAINARDAMPGGGRLVLETRDVTLSEPPAETDSENFVPGDYVALAVTDTGIGMPDEVRRRAVDPFFTTKPQGKGTGLGLSMTFGFVRQSGGYLTIESAVGRGTIITILMPRDREGP
jgi:signal transduction histidine kinase